MPQIRPIKDLRNTTEISNLCHDSNEPIFITKNGYGDMVIMSIETYEKTLAQIELYSELKVAEEQVGYDENTLDAEESLKTLRKKYDRRWIWS